MLGSRRIRALLWLQHQGEGEKIKTYKLENVHWALFLGEEQEPRGLTNSVIGGMTLYFLLAVSRSLKLTFLHHGEVRSQVQCWEWTWGKTESVLTLRLLKQKEISSCHCNLVGVWSLIQSSNLLFFGARSDGPVEGPTELRLGPHIPISSLSCVLCELTLRGWCGGIQEEAWHLCNLSLTQWVDLTWLVTSNNRHLQTVSS